MKELTSLKKEVGPGHTLRSAYMAGSQWAGPQRGLLQLKGHATIECVVINNENVLRWVKAYCMIENVQMTANVTD